MVLLNLPLDISWHDALPSSVEEPGADVNPLVPLKLIVQLMEKEDLREGDVSCHGRSVHGVRRVHRLRAVGVVGQNMPDGVRFGHLLLRLQQSAHSFVN